MGNLRQAWKLLREPRNKTKPNNDSPRKEMSYLGKATLCYPRRALMKWPAYGDSLIFYQQKQHTAFIFFSLIASAVYSRIYGLT